SSTPPTYLETRCAICSIRACAVRDKITTGREAMSYSRTLQIAAASIAATLVLAAPAWSQSETPPKAGGTLEVGTVYVTLSALSWDSADWNWKHNHDTGAVYEQLFVADLSKSRRLGGKHPFYADAWLPSDAIRGELAETW